MLTLRLRLLMLAIVLACAAPAAGAQPAPAKLPPEDLARTMADLDRKLFDAYNRCDLEAFGALFAADVEFYHDQGGLMRSRESIVEATKKNICGKVRREPVEGTLQAFPMTGYGAVQLGSHRFCELAETKCGGVARFVHLWQNDAGKWRLTRIISYDHQAIP